MVIQFLCCQVVLTALLLVVTWMKRGVSIDAIHFAVHRSQLLIWLNMMDLAEKL